VKAGWGNSTLGQSCTFQRGLTYSKSDEVDFSNTAVLRANNIDLASNALDLSEIRYISDSVSVPDSKLVKSGSLIICTASGSKSHLGKVAYIDEDYGYAFGGFMAQITPSERLDPRFLYYSMTGQAFADWLGQISSGININNLKFSDIEHLPLVLPPLAEQQRIVAVLDEAFAGIATATANAQKNLTNARALFEAYLESAFNKNGNGWKNVPLGKACKVERGSSPRPIKSFVTTEDDGQNWIKIGDTKNDSKYITQTKQRITPAGALKSRKVEPGDFILTNSMSFGKPYIMKIPGYIHDGWFALRLGEGIDTEFFYYLLSSPIVQKQFQNLAAGAIVLNISGDLVKKAILSIPPFEQQREIVGRILLVDDETSRLAGAYETKLAALAELKQSLLQKAFAGELT
jgi:type I restriction enzyme S subunit